MTKSDKFFWPFCHLLFPSYITHSISLGDSRNSAHFCCQFLLVSSSGPLLSSSSEWVFDKKYICMWGFADSSVGKEFTCNAGDPGSIPGLGKSAGEGTGHPLQYSWASLVAQLVKNPPAMQESWVRSLGWENLLEKRKATHSSILAWRIGAAESRTWLSNIHFTYTFAYRGYFERKETWEKKTCSSWKYCRKQYLYKNEFYMKAILYEQLNWDCNPPGWKKINFTCVHSLLNLISFYPLD